MTSVRWPSRTRTAWQTRRSFAHPSRAARSSPRRCACERRNRNGFNTTRRCSRTDRSCRRRSAFACPMKAERRTPGSSSVTRRPTDGNAASGARRPTSPTDVILLQRPSCASAQTGTSCRQSTPGSSATPRPTISSRNAFRPGGFVLPWKRFQVRTSRRSTVLPMRLVLADPPAFTPAYDHALAAALAQAGVEVELVTSRFRFGESPAAAGYERRELFYPLSARTFRRSRLRIPLKAAEHVPGMLALGRRRPDVLHLQWLAAPELDRYLLRPRVPAVFTAHDLLPRHTAAKRSLWRTLLARFERVVVHSDQGREVMADLGVDAVVIPHPVFPSDPPRADDGRTLLSLG